MDYHSGARFKGKKVLLVGFGNSANDVGAAALFPGLFESLKEAYSKMLHRCAATCGRRGRRRALSSAALSRSYRAHSGCVRATPPRSYSSCASIPLCSFSLRKFYLAASPCL